MNNIFSVKKFQNVFVNSDSIIVDKGNVIKDSCATEAVYEKSLKFGFYVRNFFPIFSFSKKPHILITDGGSNNYRNWLWEALSKLIEIKKSLPDSILILPKSYLKIDFVTKSLEAFGFNQKNVTTIPEKSLLRVKDLSTICCTNITNSGYYDFLKCEEVSKTLISFYCNQLKTNFGDRIYISRSNSEKNTVRKVVNEAELTAMLAKYGFKAVYMENFSFLEQVSIANNAKFIVAPHGAGIANTVFSGKALHLLELVNQKFEKTCFAYMCDKVGISYQRFDCVDDEKGLSPDLSDIVVDVKALEKELIQNLR